MKHKTGDIIVRVAGIKKGGIYLVLTRKGNVFSAKNECGQDPDVGDFVECLKDTSDDGYLTIVRLLAPGTEISGYDLPDKPRKKRGEDTDKG